MLRNYSLYMIALPLLVMLAGFALQSFIPGCRFDEGAGAHGCGSLDPLVESSITLGGVGFILGLMGLVLVLPASLLWSRARGKRAGQQDPQA